MAWCRQVTSHYMNQCCSRSLSPKGNTRPGRRKPNVILLSYIVITMLQTVLPISIIVVITCTCVLWMSTRQSVIGIYPVTALTGMFVLANGTVGMLSYLVLFTNGTVHMLSYLVLVTKIIIIAGVIISMDYKGICHLDLTTILKLFWIIIAQSVGI